MNNHFPDSKSIKNIVKDVKIIVETINEDNSLNTIMYQLSTCFATFMGNEKTFSIKGSFENCCINKVT